jgi:hypothetical protein
MIHDAYFECINDDDCEQINLVNDSYSTILEQKALYLDSTGHPNPSGVLSNVETKLNSEDTLD